GAGRARVGPGAGGRLRRRLPGGLAAGRAARARGGAGEPRVGVGDRARGRAPGARQGPGAGPGRVRRRGEGGRLGRGGGLTTPPSPRLLVVLCHPSGESLGAALAAAVAGAARVSAAVVSMHDLYRYGFYPRLTASED